MKLVFFHDGPITIDENELAHNSFINDDIIKRYFKLGDELVVVTRFAHKKNLDNSSLIKTKNVSFIEVPNINTLTNRFFKRKKAIKVIRNAVQASDAVLARLPSSVGLIAVKEARKIKKPYLLEIVGDPWESLRHHSWKGRLIAGRARKRLKRATSDAPFVMYVTDKYLQERYPTNGQSIGVSDVIIPEDSSIMERRLKRIDELGNTIIIGSLGVVHVKYKGQQHVIKALGQLKSEGNTRFKYVIAGPGSQLFLKNVAKKEGVEDQIVFLGALPHDQAIEWLDKVDVYIQPSETEGMPRALIEAMSRACCCLGSNVGGIPELLQEDDIFPINDNPEKRIAEKLLYIDKKKLRYDAQINYTRANDFQKNKLEEKRNQFYRLFLDSIASK